MESHGTSQSPPICRTDCPNRVLVLLSLVRYDNFCIALTRLCTTALLKTLTPNVIRNDNQNRQDLVCILQDYAS